MSLIKSSSNEFNTNFIQLISNKGLIDANSIEFELSSVAMDGSGIKSLLKN